MPRISTTASITCSIAAWRRTRPWWSRTAATRAGTQARCTSGSIGRFRSPIAALAAWLHALSGVPDGGFERRGGAIEQALTNCLFSLQAADGRTFDACHAETSSPPDMQR